MHNFWALVKWHGDIMVCYVGGGSQGEATRVGCYNLKGVQSYLGLQLG